MGIVLRWPVCWVAAFKKVTEEKAVQWYLRRPRLNMTTGELSAAIVIHLAVHGLLPVGPCCI